MGIFATVTSKGQITIPKEIREVAGIREGDAVAFVSFADRVMLVPRNKPVESIFGILSEYGRPGTAIEDYDEAVRDAVVDHVEGERSKMADDAA